MEYSEVGTRVMEVSLYGVQLPSRKRRWIMLACAGATGWVLASCRALSVARLELGIVVLLSSWAGFASLWFP